MFPTRYFADRYWAPRYWPKIGAAAVPPTKISYALKDKLSKFVVKSGTVYKLADSISFSEDC